MLQRTRVMLIIKQRHVYTKRGFRRRVAAEIKKLRFQLDECKIRDNLIFFLADLFMHFNEPRMFVVFEIQILK
jgi:hypothetical protein